MKERSDIIETAWNLGKVDFEHSEKFRVPAARLFSYLADLRKLPSWREEVRSVKRLSRGKGGPAVGDRFELVVLHEDTRTEVLVEISALEKDRLLELKVESSDYQTLERYRLEEAGGNTLLGLRFKAKEPGFLVRTISLFIGSAFRADLEKKLASLKAAVEESETVKGRVQQYGDSVRERLGPAFEAARVGYPPAAVVLLGLKQELELAVFARDRTGELTFIRCYPVLGASGAVGPKLCEGDRQVPEGIYTIEELNPNSRFHLSLRVGYPNAFDRAKAKVDSRKDLGGDIMIHGGSSSAGCLAVGDEAAEDLFVLVEQCGLANTRLILSPVDFRKRDLPLSSWGLADWTEELYAELRGELEALPPRRADCLPYSGD